MGKKIEKLTKMHNKQRQKCITSIAVSRFYAAIEIWTVSDNG